MVSMVLVRGCVIVSSFWLHLTSETALKADDIQSLKGKFNFPVDQSFYVPKETYAAYKAVANRGVELEAAWTSLLAKYGKAYPKEHAELMRRIAGNLPDGWQSALPVYKPSDAAVASRKYSEIVLTAITPRLPELLGGSADLTGSNLTKAKGTVDFQHPSTGLGGYSGVYVRYGVREHAMGAIANGLVAYGGIIPFVGTFLVRAMRINLHVSHLHTELCVVCCRCCEVISSQQAPGNLGW